VALWTRHNALTRRPWQRLPADRGTRLASAAEAQSVSASFSEAADELAEAMQRAGASVGALGCCCDDEDGCDGCFAHICTPLHRIAVDRTHVVERDVAHSGDGRRKPRRRLELTETKAMRDKIARSTDDRQSRLSQALLGPCRRWSVRQTSSSSLDTL
jgi:hypothetical protein